MSLRPLPGSLLRPLAPAILFAAVALRAFSAAGPEPLPFPTDISAEAPAVAVTLATAETLNQSIGGYPPRLRDAQHRQEIYARWKSALADARALHARDGDTETALLLLGRLYRQGHNLDVRQSAEEAIQLFERALAAHPDSDALNLEASYFYLSINPTFAPKGEAALLKLRRLRGTDRDLSIERGFVFAYLYQDRIEDAKRQIDRCLTFAPDDKMLLLFRDSLKGKSQIEKISGPPPPSK